MTSKYTVTTAIFLLLIAFSIIPTFLTHDQAISYSPYNYFAVQFLLFLIAASLKLVDRNRFLLSPSFIATSYININFFIGSIAFKNGLVIDVVLVPYREWSHVNVSLIYFNLANLLIVSSYFLAKKVSLPRFKSVYDLRKVKKGSVILVGFLLIIVFSFATIDLSILGGDGSFHIIPKSLGALLIFVIFFRHYSITYRIFCYILIILLFAFAAFEDKRDAIFLLLPIFLLESTRYPFTLGIKKIFLGLLGITFCGYLILVMSILRGYGEYQVTGFWDASKHVGDYIASDSFVPSFMNNIEVSYVYFHSNNAIEYILENPEKLSYGSTLIKPLFIPIPRHLFSKKPESIIQLYTSSFSQEMRDRGVSWPISIQSEMFWNFHFLGVIVVAIIFLVFNSVYLRIVYLIQTDDIINYVYLLYIYQQSLVLFRGSGMDQYFIDIIFSFVFIFLLKIIIGILVVKKS